ncbi:metallophosphoesterase family protein [Pseudodesulfovibrio sp.]|uniref:metallophosphoesterase family protein n=1 Tax=Pseudodesulfovibrio sp. TaxID=2035812 RepID=UPI002608582B|nr:metallophosphoesterase family protein [Pseudodesulfovibrio sp.]MDD3312104.1 metallophosphoesterase family protein [Pseudodesulfovibrio sp.]
MPIQLPLAVLADIHGNAAALRAVLADAKARGVTRFANLGDTFYGPLDPAATWAILRGLAMPAVLGNQDRILLEGGPAREAAPALRAARDGIGPDGLAWLRSLPATLRLDGDVLLCHGTPRDDAAYLLEDVSSGRPAMRPCSAVLADLSPEADGCTLVLAGHSHFPGRLDCGPATVVNPGSVGLPAYDDDLPPHAMASGSPHARYAIVERTPSGWDATFVAVAYDWDAAAALAGRNGRADWARWLASGLA